MLASDHLFKTVEKRLASQGVSTHVAIRPVGVAEVMKSEFVRETFPLIGR